MELNDRYVTAAVAWVRALLVERMRVSHPPKPRRRKYRLLSWLWGRRNSKDSVDAMSVTSEPPAASVSVAEATAMLDAAKAELQAAGFRSALSQLSHQFQLSAFEESILLLCLAFELDTQIGWMCGQIQDQTVYSCPNFGLAMSLFNQPQWQIESEWIAIPPGRPLRKCRLVDFRHSTGTPVFGEELQLEETILHYLRGVQSVDVRLAFSATPFTKTGAGLSPSQKSSLDHALQTICSTSTSSVVVQLLGSNPEESLRFACALARRIQLKLFGMPLERLPASALDLEDFAQLWQRDSTLFDLVLTLDAQQTGGATEPVSSSRVRQLLEQVQTPVFIITRERLDLPGAGDICIDVTAPAVTEQYDVWKKALPADLDDRLQLAGELSWQFTLDHRTIQNVIDDVTGQAKVPTHSEIARLIRRACRERTRPRLEGLAQRIEIKSTWSDLVLEADSEAILKQLCGQVRHRWCVYNEWGMIDHMNRGLGISALFAGKSGTGKTMAAEVLAKELDLDLYRVDLSSVVNKYIGETEKHLRRLFDAFESCGAILFFDECDALFGKRSEVKDSHDRYANIEINYLLQRLESYRGLVILATNNRNALDTAFLRRLRFAVTFEMPAFDQRLQIWKQILPQEPAKGEDSAIPISSLDYERLAQFHFSGGNIQNVVLNSAFRAASRPKHKRVTMEDLLKSAKDEYLKLERPINESDFQYSEAEEVAA
ncbi:ATP-binding protein [Gimesia algae]|uniref:ATP-dependent zinc metalloprotease FtsH n=1 Tax=Gimesia algae TaxID=2527971 RepID=A0A517VBR5_9PLAN|nr:AAA family ATPase [Gimesia algae]QDT90452.1 ATP-dependent zinc metalloprotease FtsH [Gimesia algae]